MSSEVSELLEAVQELRIKAAARDRVIKMLCVRASEADPMGWLSQVVETLEQLDTINENAAGTISTLKDHVRFLTTNPL